jgi:hypothetical protein
MMLCGRPPSSFGDPHAGDVEHQTARAPALASCCGESSADKLDHQIDVETMRPHDRLGAAVAACGEQFERAAAIRFGSASAV